MMSPKRFSAVNIDIFKHANLGHGPTILHVSNKIDRG